MLLQTARIFALLSGDSEFSPLVSKLKENDKRVVGCGVRSSTSDLLVAGCDEVIYFDDLVSAAQKTQSCKKRGKKARDKKQDAVDQLLEAYVLWKGITTRCEDLW